MKPTGAMKEATGGIYTRESRQTRQHIHTCTFCGQSGTNLSDCNEQQLKEALRAALRIVVDRTAGGRMLTTQAEAKEVARLCADALSQPATPSTSAGGE